MVEAKGAQIAGVADLEEKVTQVDEVKAMVEEKLRSMQEKVAGI